MKVLESGENFKELVKEGVYLVDFYADWCGPCKMLAPVLESLNSVNVVKVNVDEHQELAREYGVMSIPTLVFLKNGEVVKTEVGFKSREDIESIVEEIK